MQKLLQVGFPGKQIQKELVYKMLLWATPEEGKGQRQAKQGEKLSYDVVSMKSLSWINGKFWRQN